MPRSPFALATLLACTVMGTAAIVGTLTWAIAQSTSSAQRDVAQLAQAIECPGASFDATTTELRRNERCEAASLVKSMLVDAGANDAKVTVTDAASGNLTGPERTIVVVAQVDLPSAMRTDWNARSAANAIARSVGTTVEQVTIVDDRLEPIFDGAARR